VEPRVVLLQGCTAAVGIRIHRVDEGDAQRLPHQDTRGGEIGEASNVGPPPDLHRHSGATHEQSSGSIHPDAADPPEPFGTGLAPDRAGEHPSRFPDGIHEDQGIVDLRRDQEYLDVLIRAVVRHQQPSGAVEGDGRRIRDGAEGVSAAGNDHRRAVPHRRRPDISSERPAVEMEDVPSGTAVDGTPGGVGIRCVREEVVAGPLPVLVGGSRMLSLVVRTLGQHRAVRLDGHVLDEILDMRVRIPTGIRNPMVLDPRNRRHRESTPDEDQDQ